jgi:hypothetical protein
MLLSFQAFCSSLPDCVLQMGTVQDAKDPYQADSYPYQGQNETRNI